MSRNIIKEKMRYILNSAVITSPGDYSYRLISSDEAKEWLSKGTFESTLGYEETAKALQLLTGFKVAVRRKQVRFKEGDEALVFRLTKRLSDSSLKGQLGVQEILDNCEIGILRKNGASDKRDNEKVS